MPCDPSYTETILLPSFTLISKFRIFFDLRSTPSYYTLIVPICNVTSDVFRFVLKNICYPTPKLYDASNFWLITVWEEVPEISESSCYAPIETSKEHILFRNSFSAIAPFPFRWCYWAIASPRNSTQRIRHNHV